MPEAYEYRMASMPEAYAPSLLKLEAYAPSLFSKRMGLQGRGIRYSQNVWDFREGAYASRMASKPATYVCCAHSDSFCLEYVGVGRKG